MNDADVEATEEDDLLNAALQLLMKKLTAKDLKANKTDAGDYNQMQGEDYQNKEQVQPRRSSLRRLLRSLVTKGMSADVDEIIQEEEVDPQAAQINALKEQLRIFQTQLNKFQDKMRTATKEGNLMSESAPSGGEDYKMKERGAKFVTGTGVTLPFAALFPEADTHEGDQEQ